MNPAAVVVGAGPAGLAAAIALARHGVPTLLCERARRPLDKACGEGLLPNAVEGLVHAGVDRVELERIGRRIAGIRYRSLDGLSAEAEFSDGAAWALRRTRLSELLFAAAARLPALAIAEGVSAEVRLDRGERPSVWLGRERLRPRLVIGADGLSSRVRRAAGLRTVFGSARRWGIRQHFELAPWTDHVEVHFGDGVEAYVTPLDSGVNVAFLWRPAELRTPGGAGAFPTLLRRFPELERRLHGARALDAPRAAGPFHQRVPERARDGLVLIGDAGGYIDAVTGEGVGLALAEARALERVIAPRLAAGDESGAVPQRELERYLRAADALCRPNRQLTRALLGVARRPELARRVVRALARDPELFQHFLRASAGQAAPFRIPARSLLGLFGALFQSGRPPALDAVRD